MPLVSGLRAVKRLMIDLLITELYNKAGERK